MAETPLQGQASADGVTAHGPPTDERGHFVVQVEEGPPHGGLYELEQTTIHRVVDMRTGEVILAFEGVLTASLSRETGLWEEAQLSGVREVVVTDDGCVLIVRYHDGQEAQAPLPAS